MSEGFIIAAILIISILLIIGVVVLTVRKYKIGLEEDQRIITDKELLLLFEQEPDGFLTKKRIVEKTNLTKSQAGRRLQFLQYNGLLKYGYSNGLQYYYSLAEAIDHRDAPTLSSEPFLTVEDILTLFKHFDYRLTLQKICIATGLPIQVIKRELKFFEKEKIITSINSYGDPSGMTMKKTFTLREPYRSNPDAFLQMEKLINPELEKIYEKLFV